MIDSGALMAVNDTLAVHGDVDTLRALADAAMARADHTGRRDHRQIADAIALAVSIAESAPAGGITIGDAAHVLLLLDTGAE